MASDISKIQLGPCKVIFDSDGTSPITFETTQGGVSLNYEETTREVNVDQYGSTPVKEIVTGRNATVQVPFAEKDLDKLAKIIPGSTLVVDGTTGNKRVDVDATKVIDLYDYAKKVKIVPLDSTSTVEDEIVIYAAAPRPQLNYSYNYENELITNVTFKAYPDSSNKLIGFGDEAAV